MTTIKRTLPYPVWLEQAARFLSVGILNTALDASLYFVLTHWLGFAALEALAKGISYGAGILSSYYWNKSWTFKSDAGTVAAFVPFVVANLAALAIENAQLYERAQELAVVEERQRLARDLHDAVTQTLFSASLIAEVLPALWESDQHEGRELLKKLWQLSRGALAEMRALLLELRPAALVESRLDDLLRQLGEAFTGRTDVPVKVTVEGECRLPADVHIALYRIAQEALNNVAKHAQASQVNVSLVCSSPDPAGALSASREDREMTARLFISDVKGEGELKAAVSRLRKLGVEFETGGHTQKVVQDRDLIVLSPGVPLNLPILREAQKGGLLIVSEVEVAGWFSEAHLVGITGSNGKTTTVSLVGEILKNAGRDVSACGNIGLPFSEVATSVKRTDSSTRSKSSAVLRKP